MARQRGKWFVIIALCLTLAVALTSLAFAFGRGAKGPDVYAVQGMLKSLGYFDGKITGYYGSETQDAVGRFQQKYGLRVTGTIDDETLQSLLWAYASVKIPKKTPTPTPTPTPAPTPPPTPKTLTVPELSAEEQRMVDLVNEERRKQGLAALTVDLDLSRLARIKSQDMIRNSFFSHESPTYGSPFEMMKKFGIAYSAAGENIACNQTVEQAHHSLMSSPGHRANILSNEYTHIGIGIVDGGPCGKMFTQMFIRR